MFIKSISLVVFSLASLTLGQVCSNNGAERCLKANGVDTGYVRCENGVETTYNCASDEFCYGNGLSGIMCIHKEKAKRSNMKRQNTAFGGLESSINLFVNGLTGDAKSLSTAITNARTAMFTDPNSIKQFSTSFTGGVKANSQRVLSGTTTATNLFKSRSGLETVFTSSSKFMKAAMSNINGLSYMVTDATSNAIKSSSARNGLAAVIATTMGTTTASTKQKRADVDADYQERLTALNNLNAAMQKYYPDTFGKLMVGNYSPQALAQSSVRSFQGDSNSTSTTLNTFLSKINGSQQFMTAFSAGSITVANAITSRGNPAIANRIISQYAPKNISASTTTNVINGAANAVNTIKTRSLSVLATAVNTFQSQMPISSDGSFSIGVSIHYVFFSILFVIYSMIAPIAACCYPSSLPFAISSLVI
ncbi:hypothetical protein BB558_002730 [Smittium angustum]|uniref:Uncharacterized protein n=1 Tax=Smittium angustum TaxID=133377 RepID=A0A2U1J887_SMIAN|nr:hypothetical protein BB558_002730 [Smittium angustum]